MFARKYARFIYLALGVALALILGLAGLAWQRRWAGVRVTEWSPADGAEGVSTTTAIRIAFAEPMRRDEVEATFGLDPPVAGRLEWEGDTLVFRPTGALDAGQAYTVTLNAGAHAARSHTHRVRRPITWTFRVGEPRLVYLALDAAERLQLFVREDGTQRQLTAAEFEVWDYAVHPEGSSIAYSAVRDLDSEGADLWQVDRDGKEARLLLACPQASCTAPAWSADARRIAYERKDLAETVIGVLTGPLTPHIWLLDPLSGDTAPLLTGTAGEDSTPTPGQDPRWSPVGQRLAFYDLSAGAVQVYDLETGEQQFFDTLSGMGAWDPSGERMVIPDLSFYGEDNHAYLVRVDVSTRAVQNLTTSDTADDQTPRWSPSGEWIAFGRTALADGTLTWGAQLWLMRPDGSEAHPLVAEAEANFGAFAWRPDGGALAYVRLPIDEIADPHPELWVVSLDDSAQPVRIATDVILPGWLP